MKLMQFYLTLALFPGAIFCSVFTHKLSFYLDIPFLKEISFFIYPIRNFRLWNVLCPKPWPSGLVWGWATHWSVRYHHIVCICERFNYHVRGVLNQKKALCNWFLWLRRLRCWKSPQAFLANATNSNNGTLLSFLFNRRFLNTKWEHFWHETHRPRNAFITKHILISRSKFLNDSFRLSF